MRTIQTGKEKQLVYAHEYKRLKKALQEEFYLEAIAIGYAIIEADSTFQQNPTFIYLYITCPILQN